MSCSGVYRFDANLYGSNPAPVKLIRFTNPIITTHFVDLEALVDSGSTVTMIPKDIAQDLALQEIDRRLVRDYEGVSRLSPVYVVEVSCDTFTQRVEAVETKGIPIIGRDVMNGLEVILDGPHQRWVMR